MKSCAPTARAASSTSSERRVRAPEGEVVEDRPREQERLLRHDPELRAQRARLDVAQVVAVDQDPPLGRVVEARGELRERRLARARRADQRDRLAGRDVQVDVRQGGLGARRVGERDVVERELAAQPRQRERARPVAQVGLLVEQLEDLVERRHPGLVGRVELRELLDRVEEVVQRGDEGDEHADGDVALDRLQAAVEEDPRGHERGQQLDRREVRRVEVDRRHVRRAVLVVELGEDALVAALLPEHAHDADARERLLQVRGDRGDLLARGAVGVRADDPERERADPQHREDQEGEQCELPVEHEEDHRGADQRQRRAEQRHHAVGDELVERLDVVRQPRDQHAGLAARVEADRERLQVREELDPEVLEDALPDPAHEPGLRPGRDPQDHGGDHEGDHDEVQRAEVARDDPVVDRQLGQRRRRERRGGPEDQRREHQQRAAAVGPQQGEQPAQLAPATARRPPAADELVTAGGGVGDAHSASTAPSVGLRLRKT